MLLKNLISLFMAVVLIGCQPSTPVVPTPIPAPPVNPTPAPSVIKEAHNGKTFTVDKDSILTFALNVNVNEDYFWAFSVLGDGFEVMSDTRRGTVQTLKVKATASGNMQLQYCQFAPGGLTVLSNLSYNVVVQ